MQSHETQSPQASENQRAAESAIDGVIFDCDGTLVDTMPLHFRAWRQCLASEAVELTETLFYELGGVPSADIVRSLNARVGCSLDPELTAARKEEIYERLIPEAQPIACVIDLVNYYRGRRPMAVASGGLRRIVLRTLDVLGIRDAFRVIATAEDTARGKPEPDLFLYAASRMGVDPRRCLVYEDSPLGLEAARRAGMRGVDIRTLTRAGDTPEGGSVSETPGDPPALPEPREPAQLLTPPPSQSEPGS